MVLFASILNAQTATISGRVTGEQGNLLAGVAIFRIGDLSNAVTSDSEGRFKITVPAEQQLNLVFYYTGFESDTLSMRLKTNEQKNIDHYLSKKIQDISYHTMRLAFYFGLRKIIKMQQSTLISHYQLTRILRVP